MSRSYVIRMRSEAGEQRRIPLPQDTLVIGRSPTVDVPIEDRAASRQHLRVERRGEGVWVEDLGSTNGTHLDGAPLRGAAAWRPGQGVRIGGTTFVLEVPAAPPTGRSLRTLSLGGLSLLLVGICLVAASSRGERPPSATAAPSIEVGPHARALAFGVGDDVDVEVREELLLRWEPRHPPETSVARLVFQVEVPEDVAFHASLNGKELGQVLAVQGRVQSMSWLLPAADIRAEGENRIVVRHGHADPELSWIAWDLEIREEPRPRCARATCIEEAGRWIERGKVALEREALDPGQLFEAWSSYQRAVAQLEPLLPPPALLDEARRHLGEVAALLDRRCRAGRFAVVQAIAYGREERAWREADALLRVFPEPGHPCHEQAKDLLHRLDPGGTRR